MHIILAKNILLVLVSLSILAKNILLVLVSLSILAKNILLFMPSLFNTTLDEEMNWLVGITHCSKMSTIYG